MDYFSRPTNYAAALKMHQLYVFASGSVFSFFSFLLLTRLCLDRTPKVASHLSDVYKAVAATVACAALGALAHLRLGVGSVWWSVALIGLIFGLHGTPNTPNNASKRSGILLLFGAIEGLVVGPLVESVLDIDPSIVVTALVASVAIFVSFSLAAIYAERRSMLYLGGFLGSALSLMCLAGFVNIFARSETIFNIQLYGGLLLFIGYVCFDTQLIIEKASLGSYDVQLHALELFIDLVAIFVRILIILAKNSKKRDSNNKRR